MARYNIIRSVAIAMKFIPMTVAMRTAKKSPRLPRPLTSAVSTAVTAPAIKNIMRKTNPSMSDRMVPPNNNFGSPTGVATPTPMSAAAIKPIAVTKAIMRRLSPFWTTSIVMTMAAIPTRTISGRITKKCAASKFVKSTAYAPRTAITLSTPVLITVSIQAG